MDLRRRCGFVAVLAILAVVVFGVLLFNSTSMQRSFCQGYTNNNVNVSCPFNVPAPSPG